MEKISAISLFSDYTNFSKLLIHNFNNIDYPKELIEWIIVDDSKEYNGHLFLWMKIFYIFILNQMKSRNI